MIDGTEKLDVLVAADMIAHAVRAYVENKQFKEDKKILTACYNIIGEMMLEIHSLRRNLEVARRNGTASPLIDPRNYLNGRTKDFNNGGAK